MHTKRITKESKRRLFVFGSIASILVIYAFISFTTYILNIRNLKLEQKNLALKLETLKKDEEIYKTEIEKLKDNDYLARYAREKYLYTKDGEYVLKIDTNIVEPTEEKKMLLEKKYVVLFSCVTLFVIGFIVIKTNKKQ